LGLQLNGDTAAHYSDGGVYAVNILIALTHDLGSNAGAIIGSTNAASSQCRVEVKFCPLNDGRQHTGSADSAAITPSGTSTTYAKLVNAWCWHDTSAVTSLVILASVGSSMTGVMRVLGVPV